MAKVVSTEVDGPAGLFFGGAPSDDGIAEYRDVPTKAALRHDLEDLIGRWRSKFHRKYGDQPPREFDSAPQPEDVQGVQYIRLDENDFLRAAVGAVASSTDVPAWTRRDKAVGHPRSFVLSVKLKRAGTAHFFRRLTPAKELRGPGKVVAFLEGKRFQALEESRVILIEDSFDCVAFDGDLFIMNPLGFESLFAYATSLSQNANATIDSVQSYIDPALIGGLRSEVGSNRVYMRRLAGRIQVDLAHLGIEAVRSTVQEYHFNVRVDESGGRLRLGFDRGDPKDLIRLLTDSAVRSALTGRKFIATAKTVV